MTSKSKKYEELRKNRRYFFPSSDKVFGELSFPEISGKIISFRILDISSSGLQFTVTRDYGLEELSVGSTIILHAVKAYPALEFIPRITMEVQWIVDNPVFKNISAGCHFMDIPKTIKERIDQYIEIQEQGQEVTFCEECGSKNVVDSKVMAGIDQQPLICQNCGNLMLRESIITYSSSGSVGTLDTSAHHLLFIDDDLGYLQIMTALFQNIYKTTIAPTGKRGIELGEKLMPDLILLDVNMPDLDGFEVCERLQSNSKTHTIPIILVTSNQTDNEEGLPPGVVDYITKPINQQMFHDKIRLLIKAKLLQDEHNKQIEYLENKIASFTKHTFEKDIELEVLQQDKLNSELILNSIDSAVIIQNTEQQIVWANTNALTTFKTTLAEITQKFCYTLFQNSKKVCTDCPLLAGDIGGYSKQTEVHNDILQQSLLLSHLPLFNNDGELTGIVHLVKQKAADQLETSDESNTESVTQFNKSLSENFTELNDIVSAILIGSDTISSKYKDDTSLEEVNQYLTEAANQLRVVLKDLTPDIKDGGGKKNHDLP